MKKLNKSLKNMEANKGFTLVELIIVIAIIAVLAAVLAPQYIKYVERSRQGVDANTLSEIYHNVEVQAGLIENPAASKVIVTVASGTGTITGTDSFLTNNENFKAVTDVIGGTTVSFKSKAANKTFTIAMDANGKVSWDSTTASEANFKSLQKGTLS